MWSSTFSDLGRPAHPRRAAETRYRDRRRHGRALHGASSAPAVPDLAYVADESHRPTRLGRLLRGPDAHVSGALCLRGAAHDRRQILHVNVTGYPTAAWTAQQIRNAFPWATAPRFLLRDRDGTSGHNFRAISEFPKGRKYLISLSFRGKASVRPAQVGGFDVNIVIHGSTAVRGRGDLVAYRWALWKLTAPWTHRTRPPHLGKRCAFSTSFHRAFPIKSFTKNPERPQNSVGKPG